MIPRDGKALGIPIPSHKLLEVVAIVDEKDPQTKEFLGQIAAEKFEIEASGALKDVAAITRREGCTSITTTVSRSKWA